MTIQTSGKTMTLRLPFEQHAQLALIAEVEDTSISDVIRQAVDAYLAAHVAQHGHLRPQISIPAPHVPFGPTGIPELLADADYLDHAARNIEGGYPTGGSNVTATVVALLHSVATALRARHERRMR